MAQTASKLKNEEFEIIVYRFAANKLVNTETDTLAVEEPLEIRLGINENEKFLHRAISITMRTPGNDDELAAGFLLTEGILQSKNQIAGIKHCGKFPAQHNTVRIDLQENTRVNLKKLERNFYTTSSCGVCGKTSLEALAAARDVRVAPGGPLVSAATVIMRATSTAAHRAQSGRDCRAAFRETSCSPPASSVHTRRLETVVFAVTNSGSVGTTSIGKKICGLCKSWA